MTGVYCDDSICVVGEGAAIEVSDLSLSYDRRLAFKSMNLEIDPCSVTAIVGPSGCGKSSLLNCMNRMTDYLDNCSVEGSVKIHGEEIYDRGVDTIALRKKVGMIFQRPNPFPVSIEKNILMPLRYHGLRNTNQLAEKLETALKDVGLWDEVKDRLKSRASVLSGGQQQRLCMARTIALGPEILLMDEPCSSLDPRATATIEQLIERLRRKFTVVVVTHNIPQAKRVSDSTVVVWNQSGYGELIDHGPTERVFLQPANKTVAAYIEGATG